MGTTSVMMAHSEIELGACFFLGGSWKNTRHGNDARNFFVNSLQNRLQFKVREVVSTSIGNVSNAGAPLFFLRDGDLSFDSAGCSTSSVISTHSITGRFFPGKGVDVSRSGYN